MNKVAVIIGVGKEAGLGAAVARRAAADGLHVVIGGRTAAHLDKVATAITNAGGRALAVPTDATDEIAVRRMVEQAEALGMVELAVFNVGNNVPADFLEMDADLFRGCWQTACFAGFHFARAVLPGMAERRRGTLIFTGASASLRGKPGYAAFAVAKAGLRALSQSLAREFGPRGIHVAHVIVDGSIDGERIRARPQFAERKAESRLIGLDPLAQSYMFLHHQPANGWTHELDMRTFAEPF